MSDRLSIVVCSECGTAANAHDAEEHPFRCKCWKGPRWQLGTWFRDTPVEWFPKSASGGVQQP